MSYNGSRFDIAVGRLPSKSEIDAVTSASDNRERFGMDFSEQPLNFRELRGFLRFNYDTNSKVADIINELTAKTIPCVPMEIIERFNPWMVHTIVRDFWLYGWVVIDTIHPMIYHHDEIEIHKMMKEESIWWRELVGPAHDITGHAKLIRRRLSNKDILGHSVIEFLALPPGQVFSSACGNQWE